MHILLYVTDDGTQGGSAPILFLARGRGDKVPGHPGSMRWRYLRTIAERDRLLDVEGNMALRAIQLQGFYISDKAAD
jgi:hypothetical protein